MAKTRKYNQRKSTRGKTPKKKNKMRQNKTKGGKNPSVSDCKSSSDGADCFQYIQVGNKTKRYDGKCKDEKCHIRGESFKLSLRKNLNSITPKSVKTRMKQPTPRFKYVTPTGNSYNRSKTFLEIFGLSK